MKRIENLKWKPMWVSYLGCIKGCLEYLNVNVSDAWLFGATGHAFIINIHDVVCASGPTAWNMEMLPRLAENIGYTISGISAFKTDDDFGEKQKSAWELVKQSINENLPCIGWELEIPEYYVINGYSDNGYYSSGPKPESGDKIKQWNELGNTQIGWLEVYAIKPKSSQNALKTIKDAFGFVLEHSKNPKSWIFPKYKSGIEGFDTWINALETGKANGFGVSYNASVWSECRSFGVEFLKEAKERINGKLSNLFDEAIKQYEIVSENLGKISRIFPFPMKDEEVKDENLLNTASEYLKIARKAEESGIRIIEKIFTSI